MDLEDIFYIALFVSSVSYLGLEAYNYFIEKRAKKKHILSSLLQELESSKESVAEDVKQLEKRLDEVREGHFLIGAGMKDQLFLDLIFDQVKNKYYRMFFYTPDKLGLMSFLSVSRSLALLKNFTNTYWSDEELLSAYSALQKNWDNLPKEDKFKDYCYKKYEQIKEGKTISGEEYAADISKYKQKLETFYQTLISVQEKIDDLYNILKTK